MIEWRKLGDVCTPLRKEIIKQGDLKDNGQYPVVNSGISLYGLFDNYNNDGNAFTIASRGEYAGYISYMPDKFWAGGLCYPYRSKDEKLGLTKFIYEYLKKKEQYIMDTLVMRGGIPALNKADVDKIQIPVPSLSEQTRIVGILDTFTSAIDNLKEQIALRRKQYEYYRDQLLDLEGKPGVEMKPIADVLISLKTGLNPRKNFVLNSPGSKNYYITVRELGMFDIKVLEKTDKVTDDAIRLINNRSNLEVGDVLFSGTGTIGRTALINQQPTNWNIKEGVYSLKPRKDIINPLYLVQLLHTKFTIDKISSLTVGDPIKSIPMKSMLTISIPIPSLNEQSRIVSILDTFEASIQNLEAQLEQRQKQYEYYRNKLLTFE